MRSTFTAPYLIYSTVYLETTSNTLNLTLLIYPFDLYPIDGAIWPISAESRHTVEPYCFVSSETL